MAKAAARKPEPAEPSPGLDTQAGRRLHLQKAIAQQAKQLQQKAHEEAGRSNQTEHILMLDAAVACVRFHSGPKAKSTSKKDVPQSFAEKARRCHLSTKGGLDKDTCIAEYIVSVQELALGPVSQ